MRKWTQTEIIYLKEKYPSNGALKCGEYLNRSKNSILFKAKSLNLNYDFFYIWTNEEIEFLKTNYTIYGPKYCAKILNKKEIATQDKGRSLGLSKKTNIWTSEEISILKQNYEKLTLKKCSELLKRPEGSVKKKASRLGLTNKEFSWTQKEVDFIKNNFKEKGVLYCCKHLNRTKAAIIQKYKLFNKKNIQEKAWRHLLNKYFIKSNISKNYKNEKLEYSFKELSQRIEFNFKPGMSWDNYGKWHIDHKKPISKFNINTPAKIVNALCNLQPLWAYDNLSKGNKF